MLIRRGRTIHITPRKYESIEFSAEVEFDAKEAGSTPVEDYADLVLDTLLSGEMEEAAAVTQTESFIATYRFTGE